MLRGSALRRLLVIAFSQFNNPLTGIEEQLLTAKPAANRCPAATGPALRSAIHGVMVKHAGAGAAGWTGGAFNPGYLIVRDFRVRAALNQRHLSSLPLV